MNNQTGDIKKPIGVNPILLTSFVLSLFSALCIDLYVPALPSIQQEFNASAEASLSIFLIALGLGQLAFGALYDNGYLKAVVKICMSFFILSSGMIFLSDSYNEFLALRIVQGLSVSGLALTAIALIKDNFSFRESAKYFGYLNSVINLIPSIAPFLGAFLLSQTGDWRSCFAALVIIGAISLPIVLIGINKVNTFKSSEKFSIRFFKNSDYLRFAPIAVMSLALLLVYVTFAASIIVTKYGWSITDFSIYFAFNGFLMFCTGLTFGRLTKTIRITKLYSIGVKIITLSSVLLIAGTFNTAMFVIGFSIYCIAFCVLIASSSALSLRSLQQDIGKAISVISCLQMVIGSLLGFLIIALPFEPEYQIATLVALFAGYNLLNNHLERKEQIL